MADSIFCRQNDKFILQCQIAQRSEYTHAKEVARWKIIFVLGFTLLSIAASVANVDWLSALSSLLAVALLIFNKYADAHIACHKKHAASIQQYIDVTLYSETIGSDKSEWGLLPSKTDLADTVSKITDADTSEMKNWYSDYSSLSGESQVFLCQRENVRWDNILHKSFRRLQLILLGFVGLIMCITFFAANPNFVKLICVLSWFSTIGEYAFSNCKEIGKSILLLKKLEQFCNEVEAKLTIVSYPVIIRELIKLQYKIQERRELGYLIPDWFYRWHRKRQQEKEDKIAETIVDLSEKSGEKK